jgi:molecular chaperone GrpE
MNSNQNSTNNLESSEENEVSNTLSLDEFFRQLEEKERDLDISSELIIELDPDSEETDFPAAFTNEDLPPTNGTKHTPENFSIEQPNKTLINKLEFEISNLRTQVSKMESERIEFMELSRRRQNDYDNFKKRTERERGETFQNQISNLAIQMLPVVDNLNRALDSSAQPGEKKSDDFVQFFEGIVMVSQQLNEILAEMGVQPIIAVGKTFDPHFHEAVAAEESAEYPSNTITTELLRGYRIGEKVIRPSMVKVSTSPVTEKSE